MAVVVDENAPFVFGLDIAPVGGSRSPEKAVPVVEPVLHQELHRHLEALVYADSADFGLQEILVPGLGDIFGYCQDQG